MSDHDKKAECTRELLETHRGAGWEPLTNDELVAMVQIADGPGRTPDIKTLFKRLARELIERRIAPHPGASVAMIPTSRRTLIVNVNHLTVFDGDPEAGEALAVALRRALAERGGE